MLDEQQSTVAVDESVAKPSSAAAVDDESGAKPPLAATIDESEVEEKPLLAAAQPEAPPSAKRKFELKCQGLTDALLALYRQTDQLCRMEHAPDQGALLTSALINICVHICAEEQYSSLC